MKEDSIIEWHSPEHHFDRKTIDWYWILGIGALAISSLSIYFGNFLFGILIIVASATIGILSYKETKMLETKITAKGIIIGSYLHPWLSYQSFWIEEDHIHGPRILLRPMNKILPIKSVHISCEIYF